jgi:light-regulated signal transduction histidine kinase (bacteriophytochrome)
LQVVRYDGSAKKRLWGLVVCHAADTHYVSYSKRSALGLLVRIFSMKVEQALEMEHSTYKLRASSAEVRPTRLWPRSSKWKGK